MASEKQSTSNPGKQSSLLESELRSHVPALLKYVGHEKDDENLRKDLLLLAGDAVEPDLVIKCSMFSWKVHRDIVCSRSEYLRRKDNANGNKPCLVVRDFNLSSSRMDLYILWLYSQKFSILCRWMEIQWPGHQMQGTLEALAWASHVVREDQLFRDAELAVFDLFTTDIWVLVNDRDVPRKYVEKSRRSVNACLETLFEQETKVRQLGDLRSKIIIHMFKEADQMLPRHSWVNTWIGRSLAFKVEFQGAKKELLCSGAIVRRHLRNFGNNDKSDEEVESFDFIWVKETEQQDLASSRPSAPSGTEPDAVVAQWLEAADLGFSDLPQWKPPTPPRGRGRKRDPFTREAQPDSQAPAGKKRVAFQEPEREPMEGLIWERWEGNKQVRSPASSSPSAAKMPPVTAKVDESSPMPAQGSGAKYENEVEDDDLYGP